MKIGGERAERGGGDLTQVAKLLAKKRRKRLQRLQQQQQQQQFVCNFIFRCRRVQVAQLRFPFTSTLSRCLVVVAVVHGCLVVALSWPEVR